ncbi:U3 snoRNP protein [Sporothrix bragantina]|uniref:U3 small nucleolar RNA-associated protein 22 n=1 Tax=Sporothrix bragantina TaxID=671064 RepID=A0ABP0BS52_9PEZI
MDSNPAKRRKTDHSAAGEALPFDAAAASAGLFRPSTFILETAELLQQSRVDYGKLLPNAEELLRNVKTVIESVDPHGPVLISKATATFEKKNAIKIPYPTPRPADESLLKLSMEAPAHCNVVGSYVLKTMVRSQREFAVDMIVEMPKALFQDKDYLNLRYFYKRAYYLAHLAKAVSKSEVLADAVVDVSFAYLGDNPLQPIIVITPKTTTEPSNKSSRSASVDCKIRIIPCCPTGLFPAGKLLANKNCLRPDAPASTSTPADTEAVGSETKPLPPTPFYNATLKAEAAYVPYLKLLHQAQKSCSAFVDACLLGHVWLQQRGFGSSLARGGFGSFEFAALVALLLQTGSKKQKRASSSAGNKKAMSILSPSLSSTQIFKAVVQFLASTDFRTKPCILGGPMPEGGLDALKEGTPVLFDAGNRQLNIAYKMSAWSAGLLRQHAKRTHELLKDDSVIDQFTPTFIARADIALEAYDMVVRVRCPPIATATANNSNSDNLSRQGTVWDFGNNVFQTIKRAMGDRATLVHVQLPSSSAWAIGKPVPEIASTASTHVVLGISFDANNMSRHIDHGPPAEDKKEARKFRDFWGERAELRRFKDGSILETLVWTAGQSASALCEEITRYILGHRLGLTAMDAIEVLAGSDADGSFSSLVPLTPVVDAAAFTLAREAFATLEADIRALEDLPLHVRQLAPIDAALRSSTIAPPAVQSPKAVLHPMEVALFFEASGKWPDNLAAIQRAKIAFLLRIGESLEAAKAENGETDSIETYIGLENTTGSSETEASRNGITNLAYLDIVYRENAAFRLRIHSDLEEAILSRQTHDKTLDQRTRTTSAHLLAATRRTFVMLPLHNQTIATYCTRFPALSPTIRLVKRWFSAHKLTSHVSAEFIELIVLHVFLQPYPWQTPASPAPGLLRVLQFLARWDWRTEPLNVDTSGMAPLLPEEEQAAAAAKAVDPRTRLEAWRKIDPNMNHTVLFVSATHETSGTAFTTDNTGGISRPQPSKVVASRMTSLARAACRLVKEKDVSVISSVSSSSETYDFDPALLFQPSLGDFDVLIHLSPRVIKRLVKGDIAENNNGDAAGKPRRSIYKNLDARTGRELHALPAHPVQLLLDQLNQVYGGASAGGGGVGPIVFFYGAPQEEDKDGDHVIAALWNPQVHPRTFRINVPCSFRPVAATKADKKKAKAKVATTDDEAAADAERLIEVNREGILAEIARIGGTLIDQIEIVNKA